MILLATDAGLVLPALMLAGCVAGAGLWGMGPALWPGAPVLAVAAIGLSWWLGLADIPVGAYELRAMGRNAALSLILAAMVWVGIGVPAPHAVGFALAHLALCVGARVVMYQALVAAYGRAGTGCRVLIYGAGATGLQLARALADHPTLRPVGFVDDNPALHGVLMAGLRVHAPIRLSDLLAQHRIDRVLVATPSLSPPRRARLCAGIETHGVPVTALPSFAQLAHGRGLVDALQPPVAQFLPRPEVTNTHSVAPDAYSGQSVLITGAGGSIGSELARQMLVLRPARLVLLDASEYALYQVEAALRPLALAAGVPLVPVLGTVCDQAAMARLMQARDIGVVLHAAAYKHVPMVEQNPRAGLQNNVLGTEALMRAAMETGVARFLLISSDKAVRPAGLMGGTKWMAEQVVRSLAAHNGTMATGVVRFGNVLGSSGSVVPLFQDQVRRGGPVTITDPDVERYFMTVDEAVHLVLDAGAMAGSGDVYVLDMGAPVRIADLACQVIEAAGYTVRDAANPDGDIALAFTGLRPGEKLTEELSHGATAPVAGHPKLRIAEEPLLPEIEIARMLREIHARLDDALPDDLVRLTQRWTQPRLPMAPAKTLIHARKAVRRDAMKSAS